MFKNRDNIKYIIVSFCITITVIALICLKIIQEKESKLVINGISILEKLEKNKIGIYIDGEVNNPGFIRIPKGKNLEYAINKVQGITKEADINNIDLKQVLKNGEKIFIPSKKEDIENREEQAENYHDRININTASMEELKMLNGIGNKTAENIIKYRENNMFDSIEEIIEVKGIGEGKYEKIKKDICV